MMKPLKIGLVGAGVFAGYHANKLAAQARTDFLGVYDPDDRRANALAAMHQIGALSLEELLDQCDAVVIACPASYHGQTAIKALEAMCHCLIEKPLATSQTDAAKIVHLADECGLTVQVGHQERIVFRVIGLDKVAERPVRVTAIRSNPYSARGTDTSVTMDLMTHDIDLCTMLFGQAPDNVVGKSVAIKSDAPDESHATLQYGEAVVELAASRVVEAGQRQMTIQYLSGTVHIDFNAKTLTHDTPFDLNVDFGDDPRAQDSLGTATDIFVQAVLDKTKVLVTAREGEIAVKTALQIDGD